MCQFARLYPVEILKNLLHADKELERPTVDKILSTAKGLNEFESKQKALAESQSTEYKGDTISQQPVAQIEQILLSSCVSSLNWVSHVILMNHNLSLGIRYWYMQEAVLHGWSRNILDLQIKSRLFQRQIKENKVSNFSKNLPDPQSDLANYLLKDPYIFDLAGARERV